MRDPENIDDTVSFVVGVRLDLDHGGPDMDLGFRGEVIFRRTADQALIGVCQVIKQILNQWTNLASIDSHLNCGGKHLESKPSLDRPERRNVSQASTIRHVRLFGRL